MKHQRKFYMLLLLINIIAGTGVSYYIIISQQPQLPEIVVNEAQQSLYDSAILSANSLNTIFGKSEGILKTIQAFATHIFENDSDIPAVQSYYHNKDFGAPPALYYSDKYDRPVSYEASAYKIAPRAFDEAYQSLYLTEKEVDNPLDHISSSMAADINKSAKLDHLWKIMPQSEELAWMYMGFEEGFHRTYPWHSLNKQYDPTHRPWYSLAATGAKDITIVIDQSGSMKGEKLEQAKNITTLIVNSLSKQDRFNVMSYNYKTRPLFSSLEVVSDTTINQTNEFLHKLRPELSSDMNQALVDSLNILNTYSSIDRKSIVLVLTDGKPSTGITSNDTIIENVLKTNAFVDAKINFIGLGNDLDVPLMQTIADQNAGQMQIISENLTVPDAVNEFSSFLSQDAIDTIYWNAPILDASGLGLIITASAPVRIKNQLVGVVALDMTLNHLVNTINTLKPQESTAAFIFDVGGISIFHPAFSSLPIESWDAATTRQPIEKFETYNPAFVALKEAAKAGHSGFADISYPSGEKIVAMSPIGNTSMILGFSGLLSDFVGPDIQLQLDNLRIDPLTIIPGVIFGVLVSIPLYFIVRSKYLQEVAK